MANTFTREDLEGMRRSEIRTLAVSEAFGMSPKEAVSAPSAALIEFILSKQGGEKKAAGGKKAAGKSAPAPEPEAVPEAAEEEAPEATPPSSKTSKKEEAGIVTRIDKLGLSLDEVENVLKGEISDVKQQVYVLMAMVKLMLGTTDLEPDDVAAEIEKATEEYEGLEGKD
jgi:hypothetical protein